MLFLTGWLVLVYFPVVHMCGAAASSASGESRTSRAGSCVHNIAGIAALMSVFYVGKRRP